MDINKCYYIVVQPLTPVSIGNGEENDLIQGLDYVIHNGKIYILSLKKLMEAGLSPEELSMIYNDKDSNTIISKLGNDLEKIALRIVQSVPNNLEGTANHVKANCRNQFTDEPFMPGSSLKGAIRSHILAYLIKKENINPLPARTMQGMVLEERLIGSLRDGESFMRFIQIPDITFHNTFFVNTVLYNLQSEGDEWYGGWKHGKEHTDSHFNPNRFNTFYESLPLNEEALGMIKVSPEKFNISFPEGNTTAYHDIKLDLMDPHNLFSIIREQTLEHMEKDLKFFEEFEGADNDDRIISRLKDLIQKCHSLSNNECIIRMSAGSGYHSITGDWQYDDYVDTGMNNGRINFKSRRIALTNDQFFEQMGYVKLKLIDKEKAEKLQEENQSRVNSHFEQYRLSFKEKEKAEKMAQEQIAQKEELERTAKYAISEAEVLYESKDEQQLQEVLQKIVKLQLKLPDEESLQSAADKIRCRLDELKEQQKSEQNKAKSEEFMKNKLEKARQDGLQLDNIRDFSKLIAPIKQHLKAHGIDMLSNPEDLSILEEALTRLYNESNKRKRKDWMSYGKGTWIDIESWAGENFAKTLYDKLINQSNP